jgi:hypothetical protein
VEAPKEEESEFFNLQKEMKGDAIVGKDGVLEIKQKFDPFAE